MIKKIIEKLRKNHTDGYSLESIDHVIKMLHPKKGFYIDVGSNDPRFNSSTFLLYKNGWRGICIDPAEGFSDSYKKIRPEDTFINKAIHSSKKSVTYYQYGSNGMNTIIKKRASEIDELHKLNQQEFARLKIKTTVQAEKLSKIISDYIPSKIKLSLLAIDVEGAEIEVLKSVNLKNKKNRPVLIIIEALGYDLHTALQTSAQKPKSVKYLLNNDYVPCVFLKKNIIFYDKYAKNQVMID